MTRPIVLLVLAGAAAIVAAGAADAAAKKNGATLSLDPARGYFHQVHAKKVKLTCTGCHSRDTHDVLFLRKDDVVPAAMPGQVNRSICLGCHTAPNKPAWYGLSRR
jgi:hypothetical protein